MTLEKKLLGYILGVLALILVLVPVFANNAVSANAYGERISLLTGTNPGWASLFTAEKLAELQAEGDFYRGNYAVAVKRLSGHVLADSGVALLARAELAGNQDSRALGLIQRFGHRPSLVLPSGISLAKRGYPAGAERVLLDSLTDPQIDVDATRLALAEIYLTQGRWNEAQNQIKLVKSDQPNLPQVSVVEGDLALLQQDYGAAFTAYEVAQAAGHLTGDQLFLAKLAAAGIGAGKPINNVIAALNSLAPQSGLGSYINAERLVTAGDLPGANRSLLDALSKQLPGGIRAAAENLYQEIQARLKVDNRLKQVIDSSN